MSFFAMGGYAAYVWPAFGVAAAILVVLLAVSGRTLRSREALLRKLEAARGPRRRGSEANSEVRTGQSDTPVAPPSSGEKQA